MQGIESQNDNSSHHDTHDSVSITQDNTAYSDINEKTVSDSVDMHIHSGSMRPFMTVDGYPLLSLGTHSTLQ